MNFNLPIICYKLCRKSILVFLQCNNHVIFIFHGYENENKPGRFLIFFRDSYRPIRSYGFKSEGHEIIIQQRMPASEPAAKIDISSIRIKLAAVSLLFA